MQELLLSALGPAPSRACNDVPGIIDASDIPGERNPMKLTCPICLKERAKRACKQRQGADICPRCCATLRGDGCAGCVHHATSQQYRHERLKGGGDKHFIVQIKPELEGRLHDALSFFDAKKMSAGEAILAEAERTDPGYYLLDFAQGVLLLKRERADDALACFEAATKKYPYFLEAHINMGIIYKMRLDIPNAVRCFKEAIRVGDADDENVVWARSFLADLDRNLRQSDGVSLDTFVQANLVFEEAVHSMERGQWDDALRQLNRCMALNPSNPKTHGNAGICLAKLGRKQDALDALDKAIEIDPGYEPAVMNRAVFERMAGDAPDSPPVEIIDYTRDYKLKKKSIIGEAMGRFFRGGGATTE
jgi:tetratricopeptide (TPR) repeat protein